MEADRTINPNTKPASGYEEDGKTTCNSRTIREWTNKTVTDATNWLVVAP